MEKSEIKTSKYNPALCFDITYVDSSALIARFMGYNITKSKRVDTDIVDYKLYKNDELMLTVPETFCDDPYGYCLTDLVNQVHYKTSWDWLMPVYRKITDIFKSEHDKDTRENYNLFADIQMAILEVDFKKTYDSIIKFIEYYNASQAKKF
jgi:hypothetical protein